MEVQLIRQLLEQLLDYHYDFYVGKLRDWFANRMSKEQFDTELSSILRGEVLQLHNQLLLAILIHSKNPAPNLKNEGGGGGALAIRTYGPAQGQGHGHGQGQGQHDNSASVTAQQISELLVKHNLKMEDFDSGENPVPDPTCLFKIQSRPQSSHVNTQEIIIDTSSRFPDIFMSREVLTYPGEGRNPPPGQTQDQDQERMESETEASKENEHRYGGNLYGRTLMDAWKWKLGNIQSNAFNLAVAASVDHIKHVVIAIIKQRKGFRVRDGRYVHSIGTPYPNPYLLKGHQIFDETYSSETAKLADVMQIPSFLPTREEKERLAALEVSASVPSKYPHLITKATLSDFYDVMICDRKLIPNTNGVSAAKLKEVILQKSKGYGDAYSSYEGSKDLVAKTVYPVILY